jgi:L-fucose isomerase-like protein
MPRILYVPVGRPSFDLAAADRLFRETLAVLAELDLDPRAPLGILTTIEELTAFLRQPDTEAPDLILFQNTTFVGADFVSAVATHCPAPIVVWAVREPEVGGRLRLNSLTGANSACHALRDQGRAFDFWLGNPHEPALRRQLQSKIRAARAVRRLAGLRVGVVGEPPPGFAFSGARADALRAATGVGLVRLDLAQVLREAEALPESEWQPVLERAAGRIRDLPRTAPGTIKFARVTARLAQHRAQHDLGALAIRCWPEFFREFGAAACSTLSFFTEAGIVAACESDIHGAISMFLARELSGGQPPYLGDLVHVDEDRQAVVFWHCGAGAPSLAHPATGARAGGHPNNGLGLTLEFGLKPGQVTICRLSFSAGRYRLLAIAAEALDAPQRFHGTTVEVRLPGEARTRVDELMRAGFEPHYVIVHADITRELADLARLLGLECTTLA